MNPDVAAAVGRLRSEGVLTEAQAVRFGRVARGELVSVRPELRLLLYGGVLAVMGGVSSLVQQNLDRIGPVAIAAALGLAAAAALLWAFRHAPPFSWAEAPSPNLAFDYILLLGVLLTGATLAYTEVKFATFGAAWSAHLLLMSLFAGSVAVRGDSRVVAGIALSTFAAWRGVEASPLQSAFWTSGGGEGPLRLQAVITGLLFVGLGLVLVRTGKKAHFEPLCLHLGWLLILGAILSGIGEGESGTAFRLALLVVGYRPLRGGVPGRPLPALRHGPDRRLCRSERARGPRAFPSFFAFGWFSGTGRPSRAGAARGSASDEGTGMREDAALADRRFEVREAARGWRRAHAIDEAALARVYAASPEDRSRLGLIFRLLVFGFTIMAANSCFGGFGLVIATAGEHAGAALLTLFGVALVAATEYQLGPLRRRQRAPRRRPPSSAFSYLTGGLSLVPVRGFLRQPGDVSTLPSGS